jgi:beta-glucanase (GH16 family)
VFSDDFPGSSLNAAKWTNHIWYDPGGAQNPAVEITVSNSVLKLQGLWWAPFSNWAELFVTTGPSDAQTADAIWKGKYGYFECRMRYNAAPSSLAAFWLSAYEYSQSPENVMPSCPPCQTASGHCYNAEIDIFEALALDTGMAYGTLHKNTGDRYSTNDQINAGSDHQTSQDLTQWHTHAVKWTASEVTWYMDNVQLHTTSPFDSTPQEMFIVLSSMPDSGSGWEGGPPNDQIPCVVEYDWVKVWQQ